MRRRNASDEPAKVSLPAGVATTAPETPTAQAGSVTVPANIWNGSIRELPHERAVCRVLQKKRILVPTLKLRVPPVT